MASCHVNIKIASKRYAPMSTFYVENRTNIEAKPLDDNLKLTLFIPFVDSFIQQLNDRSL